MNLERQLATIRKISNLVPIEGADKIELAVIDGWQVVVKKGEFQVGELVCYLEIDSFVPHTVAPFLTKEGHYPKTFKGIEGQRLRTAKLRGALSQGLVLPKQRVIYHFAGSTFDEGQEISEVIYEGADVTDILGVIKWEKELSPQLAGLARGNFPTAIPKTDQPRIQNLTRQFEEFKIITWEVTEKLDGSSCTFFLDEEGVFHVCSRNLDLKESEENAFWKAARKYDLENAMREAHSFGMAIQGELLAPGVQGNAYKRNDVEFFVFDIYDSRAGKYLSPVARKRMLDVVFTNLQHVPIVCPAFNIEQSATIKDVLTYAEGKSRLESSAEREGLVFKANDYNSNNQIVSWKCISNSWLAKEKD